MCDELPVLRTKVEQIRSLAQAELSGQNWLLCEKLGGQGRDSLVFFRTAFSSGCPWSCHQRDCSDMVRSPLGKEQQDPQTCCLCES